MVLISALEYLASRIRFILFVSALKGALCCSSANISFAVESMSRQRDGGIVPVNGHIAPMDVNAKGSDKITTNNHIITVDVEVYYV